jgi:hypothetical protein
VDDKTLTRAFDQLEQQVVAFDSCQIAVTSPRAVASCEGHATYVPKIGSKTTRVVPRRWTFILQKPGSEWTIKAVESR